MRHAIYLSILGALVLNTSSNCLAAETTDTAGSAAPSSVTLQGGVVKVDTSLNELRDARLSISRVRKATANLYDEVTRQQVTMGFNPNVVGSTVIMAPTASFNGPLLPARKKWVDASIGEIGPIIKLFKEDVDYAIENNRRTDVRDSARQTLNPLRESAFQQVKDSFVVYKNLEELCAREPYDNNGIASATKKLDNQMKQLDRNLKRGISILQKEAKAMKKSRVSSLVEYVL